MSIGMARRARNQIVLLPIVSFTCRPPGLCFRLVHKPATNVAGYHIPPLHGTLLRRQTSNKRIGGKSDTTEL